MRVFSSNATRYLYLYVPISDIMLTQVSTNLAAWPPSAARSPRCCVAATVPNWLVAQCPNGPRARSGFTSSRRSEPWHNGYVESFNSRIRDVLVRRWRRNADRVTETAYWSVADVSADLTSGAG